MHAARTGRSPGAAKEGSSSGGLPGVRRLFEELNRGAGSEKARLRSGRVGEPSADANDGQRSSGLVGNRQGIFAGLCESRSGGRGATNRHGPVRLLEINDF